MPKQTEPIRCFEGNAKPYEPFWNWRVRDEVQPESEPELEFYGYISEYSWWGDEITPQKFKNDLQTFGKGGPVTVRINSGGGEVIAASVIRSILVDYPGRVTVRIDGLCASAAVMVALSGDVIRIQDSAYVMIHNPGYSLLMGYLTEDILTDIIDQLRTIRQGMLDVYSVRTQLDVDKLAKMLSDETWMSASQAVELGFADEVINNSDPVKKNTSMKNLLDNYKNVPPALLNLSSQDEPPQVDVVFEREAQRLRDEIDVYRIL